MRTSSLHGEFDQLLVACSEGCGLHLRMRTILTGTRLYYSMLLASSVQSHYPMIVTSNILVKEGSLLCCNERVRNQYSQLFTKCFNEFIG